MFKWLCLAVAVVFLVVLTWMINDVRLQVRESSQLVRKTGETVNEHLPVIVEKTQTSTETLAELAEDIKQIKDLAGVSSSARDKTLVAFADGILDRIEISGGTIGLKKTFGGSGLTSESPAKEWVVAARKEALLLTFVVKSKKELLKRLADNKFGYPWYIRFEDKPAVTLMEWLKANHPAVNEVEGK
jgi:hypothetical protein